MLIDICGRVATDPRWPTRPDLLTGDEVVGLIRIAVIRLGVEEVRFTGGEPLPRPGLVGIVLQGLAAARADGLTPVKVNAVLMPERNDDEAPELLARAMEKDYGLRFVEQVPLDAQHGRRRDGMITAGDLRESLSIRFTLASEPDEARGSAPTGRRLVDGGPGPVGVIGSVTCPFCRACDRTLLTADGRCAPACSHGRSPTCAGRCAPGRRTRRSRGWSARCGGRGPAPAPTNPPSSSLTGRCRPSAADTPGVERNDVHRQNQE